MALKTVRLCSLLGISKVVAAVTLSVASSGGNASSPFHYGLMFEDINHSGDGGVYAELIQNRAFQAGTLEAWSAVGDASLALDTTSPLSSALPTSVQVTSNNGGLAGISNTGWWGIDVKEHHTYRGSFYSYGAYSGNFTASLVSDITQEVLGSVSITSRSSEGVWTQHTYELIPTTSAANSNNSFHLQYDAPAGAVLGFNLISLFPPTFNDRPNGNRIELMQALKDLNPKYFRIPGGNNLEGNSSPNYWNWSATLGPLTDRPGRAGTWGYHNTDGLGLVEYMDWCTDLGVEPVLALWGGLFLDGTIIPEDELSFYVDDALNELEFLMGDPSTTFGALRASLGRSVPWKIRFVEIGNEDNLNNGGDSYKAYRFNMFYDAITAKYPDILIFSSTTNYRYKSSGWDYHEYTRPDMFVSQFGMFDNWALETPIMVGEFAAVQNNTGKLEGTDWSAPRTEFPYWIGAVAEAVFLLGTERNSAKLWGVSYAPLLQNLDSYEWTPDLIAFTADPSQTLPSVSYEVLKLLGSSPFAETLPVTVGANTGFGPAFWVAGQADDRYILKAAVYNSTTDDVQFSVTFEALKGGATGQLTVLSADSPFARNTPAAREQVKKSISTVTANKDGTFEFSLPNLSVAVFEAAK